jgi:hypothetical protein
VSDSRQVDQPETRADAGDGGAPPPPRQRRVRLATVDEVRVEMGRVYRRMGAAMPIKDGYTLIMALSQIGRITEATQFEARLAELERRLKGGG